MAEPQTARVLIPHPTEELIFAKLQKELISDFFEEGRIMYAVKPLWIPCDRDLTGLKPIVETGALEATATEIYVPVTISADNLSFKTRLLLVRIHSGKEFSDSDRKAISQKKQPVRQLKIFRLGLMQDVGPHAKSISNSKWCKLHHTRTTVE